MGVLRAYWSKTAFDLGHTELSNQASTQVSDPVCQFGKYKLALLRELQPGLS